MAHVPGNPLDIVEHAIAESCDDRSEDDEIWCVFDVEAPTPHANIEKAIKLAEQKGICCAVSNPCFEIWLLLHFRDYRRYLTTETACLLAETRLTGYLKSKKHVKDAVALLDKFAVAQSRAIALENIHDRTNISERNPSTTAWKPVESLLKLKRP